MVCVSESSYSDVIIPKLTNYHAQLEIDHLISNIDKIKVK